MPSARKPVTGSARRGSPAKHRKVTASLLAAIRAGRYRPGDLLPSEPELSRRYGVSRHTVRIALRALNEQGLILSRQGRGSEVQAVAIAPRYNYACDSIADLLQYAQATPRRLLDTRRIRLDVALAAWLGSAWWELHTCRLRGRGGAVIASSRIYLPLRYARAVRAAARSALPLFALLEREHAVAIAQVRQSFAGGTASPAEATDLGIAPGAAVMCVERRFFDPTGRLVEASRSVHPPADFRYEMTVRQVLARAIELGGEFGVELFELL